ncbi:MAG TPA: ABC transporter permease [Humisphaera sp.]|nr:ABC transporter permease [Humisphaera sp.]
MNTQAATQSTSSLRRPGWRGWALLSPLVGWLALFVIAPTLILLICSFFENAGMGEIDYRFTLQNFARIFQGEHLRFYQRPYIHVFIRSIEYAGATTILCALIGYPVAYFIGRCDEKWRGNLLMLVMIPFMTSFLIRTYAWFTILDKDGLLNSMLEALHIIPNIIKQPIELLYTPAAVMIALVYMYLPFMILPIYGSVEKLDRTLLEAASDLGAGPVRTFFRVTLPLTWPGISAGILMTFVPAIAMFAVTRIMSGGHIRLIGDEIQEQFEQAGDLPFGSALGMALLALFVVIYLITNRKSAAARPLM